MIRPLVTGELRCCSSEKRSQLWCYPMCFVSERRKDIRENNKENKIVKLVLGYASLLNLPSSYESQI